MLPVLPGLGRAEREHLTGWQGAESKEAARRTAAFSCPGCGQVWSEQDRAQANLHCRLLHQGQTIEGFGEDSVIGGELPQTDTLGFRWSAANNLFLTAADLAGDEWRSSHAPDEENAEREMRQFVWCLPVLPVKLDQTSLEVHELAARMLALPRGVMPAEATVLTAGIDLGKYLCHWIVTAWSPGASGHVVDYGRIEVASESLGLEPALLVALREFKDLAVGGWPRGSADGERVQPGCAFVDAGYMTEVVYAFCREVGERFRPAVGRGAGQQRQQWYNRPTQTGSIVRMIGQGWHAAWLPAEQLHLFEVDADHWKSWAHQRLSTPVGQPGAMTLFHATVPEHLSLAKHLTAETRTEEFVAGKGIVTRWERLRRQNHWFDALYNACCAGNGFGVRLVGDAAPEPVRNRDDDGTPRISVEEWLGHKRW